jgi:trimeric autotransporter adhesin
LGTAFAGVGQGIDQSATNWAGTAGTASVSLDNSGSIGIGAAASATGVFWAGATATVGTGIEQDAWGIDLAVVSIDNSGSIEITADADAGAPGGSAFAGAFIGTGISQNASAWGTGGAATATLVNSNAAGTAAILIAADAEAHASDGDASAFATIGLAIGQNAAASSAANVGLVNDGTIDVLAAALATGDDDITAIAGASLLIFQSASAFGTGGDASAFLVNTGSIIADADATAIGGGDPIAIAFNGGIVQLAAGGTTGTANVTLDNTGLISITADALGIGGGNGTGLAFASGGLQVASAGGGATASIVNIATMTVAANADILVGNAAQKGASAVAVATALGWAQSAIAATVTATGTIGFTAAFPGTAVTSDTLTGVAFVRTATFSNNVSGPALASFVNEGTYSVTAGVSAIGDDSAGAVAIASGLTQFAAGTSAVASVVNDGTMTIAADAFASGDNGAFALAVADGIDQAATAANFVTQVVTAGTGTIHLTTGGATVLLPFTTGVSAQQTVFVSNTPVGYALASVTNNGVINVAAAATAIAGGNDGPLVFPTAGATAVADASGIEQFARGATASAVVDNSGTLAVSASAAASGAQSASAVAAAAGIVQGASAVAFDAAFFAHLETVTATDIFGHTFTFVTFVPTGTTVLASTNVGPATAIVTNSGVIDVSAVASAVAGTAAFAAASAVGVVQSVAGTVASAFVSNSGDIDVFASAFASGTTASASAFALGVGQYLAGTTMNATFINSGVLAVEAVASAVAPAFATAIGYQAAGFGGGYAERWTSPTPASCWFRRRRSTRSARQLPMRSAWTFPMPRPWWERRCSASPIDRHRDECRNDRRCGVRRWRLHNCHGHGGRSHLSAGQRQCHGHSIASGINNMVVTNSGSIFVDAITTNGAPATANGLIVTANGLTAPLATDIFTFTNDGGTIIVRESEDGGATWRRGMAIDVASAPNNSVINLLGDGLIYGNIDVQAGDNIFVEDGVTVFDGIVNPECMPPEYDNPLVSACGQGTLTIQNDGNLCILVDGNDDPSMDDGPSYVFVDTFNVADDGAIWFELSRQRGGNAADRHLSAGLRGCGQPRRNAGCGHHAGNAASGRQLLLEQRH